MQDNSGTVKKKIVLEENSGSVNLGALVLQDAEANNNIM